MDGRRSTDGTIASIQGEVHHLGEAYKGLDTRLTAFEHKVDDGFKSLQSAIAHQARPNYSLLWSLIIGSLTILLVLGNMRMAPIETSVRNLSTEISNHARDGHPHTTLQRIQALDRMQGETMAYERELYQRGIEDLQRQIDNLNRPQ